MSTPYTLKKTTHTAAVTIHQDGDGPTAASVLTALEVIGDNTGRTHDKAFFGVEGYFPVPLGLPASNEDFGGSPVWSPDMSLGGWVQVLVGSAGAVLWSVPTPIKGRITEVWAEIAGAGGPGGVGHVPGGLPATLPTLTLYRVAPSEGAMATVGTATDAPASAAAYDAVHTFGKTAMTEDIGSTRSYLVKLEGETGAGALPDELLLARIMVKIEAAP